jgi:hypothetical protein
MSACMAYTHSHTNISVPAGLDTEQTHTMLTTASELDTWYTCPHH